MTLASRSASLILLALVLLIACGCGRSPQTYVARGNRLADAGKYPDAVLEYRKALQKAPGLGEAYYRLGLAQIKENLRADAYSSLRRASELMPGDDRVWGTLGDLSLRLYNADARHPEQLYDQAAKAADRLLSANPGGFDGNRIKGAIALVDRKPEIAIDFLRKAEKARPGDPEATLGLARELAMVNQAQAGLDLALGLIRKDKTFGPAYDFLFAQYQAAGKTQEAEDILKLKVSNNPENADFLLELARYYAAASKPAEMNAALQRMLDRPADFPDGRIRVGDFYSSQGKLDEAIHLYREGAAASPKDATSFRKRLVRLLAGQRKFPEALEQADTILKTKPDDQETKLARAAIWLEEGKPESLDPALTELRAQVRIKPRDPVLHYQLGLALFRKGDPDGALREWTASAGMNRSYLPPRLSSTSLELAQGRPLEALRISEEILAIEPANADARLLNAVCLIRAVRLPEARNALNRLISDSPRNLNARYQLGVLAISEGKYAEAERIFQELQNAAAGNPQVIAGLARAYQGRNQSGQAIQLLQDELKRSPKSQSLRGLLAGVAAVSGNPDLAIEQYKQMMLADPKSVEILIALGRAYETKGDYAAAESVFAKAAQTDPKSVMASLKLASTLWKAGRTTESKAAYRRALLLQPDDPRALNNLAFLMLDTGESVDEALQLAQRGLRFADDPALKNSLRDTVGWAYLKKKMYDPALQTFQTLVASNPANATFHYHLGAVLYARGDKRQARVELESALTDKPAPGDEPKIRDLLNHL
jgi:tetratricopeptide (TPR) repeat protein